MQHCRNIIYLSDYLNTFAGLGVSLSDQNAFDRQNITMENILIARKEWRLPTIEERYRGDNDPEMHGEIAKYPEVVKRVDSMAHLVNNCNDLITFKRALNEISRVLCGSDRMTWRGPEANPDLLEI